MTRIIKCFLETASVNKMNLCVASIKVHFYHHLVSHIRREHLNAPKSVLYEQKSAVSQLITLNPSVMIRKKVWESLPQVYNTPS